MALVTGRQLSKGADELIHVALGGGKTGFRSGRNGTTEAPWPALEGFENQSGLSCHLWVEGIEWDFRPWSELLGDTFGDKMVSWTEWRSTTFVC